MKIYYLMMFFCYVPLGINAGLNKNLSEYLKELNTYSHVDKSEIYNSQRAGYMTGGGVSVRNGATDTKFANIQLPSFEAGCGGIDIFTGGISFVSHDELVLALKNITSAAGGYAFMLSIETISPSVASTLKQMQTWANTINSLGINSCEVATGLVGSVWPQRTAAKQQICRSAKTNAFASSYINARHQCSDKGDFARTMKGMSENSLHEDLLLEEYNLAWKAIQKQHFLANNKALAQEVMSLTGTIIVRQNETIVIEPWPSRIYDESFLQTLLEGGSTNFYQCGENDKNCLTLTTNAKEITLENSWNGRIKQTLATIQQKILTDTELSVDEIDLLSKSRIPLFKIVNILTAYNQGISPVSLYEVADIVGLEMLVQYLQEIIGNMRISVSQLARAQLYDFDLKDFLQELDRVEQAVRTYETRSFQRLEAENQLLLKIETLEKKIASQIILF